jgi:hypothetical protein
MRIINRYVTVEVAVYIYKLPRPGASVTRCRCAWQAVGTSAAGDVGVGLPLVRLCRQNVLATPEPLSARPRQLPPRSRPPAPTSPSPPPQSDCAPPCGAAYASSPLEMNSAVSAGATVCPARSKLSRNWQYPAAPWQAPGRLSLIW